MKLILQPEEGVDTEELCEQLKEQARRACQGNSDSVDRLEWKAAIVIRALVRALKIAATQEEQIEKQAVYPGPNSPAVAAPCGAQPDYPAVSGGSALVHSAGEMRKGDGNFVEQLGGEITPTGRPPEGRTASAEATTGWEWPVNTVGRLIANLQTLPPTLQLFTAYFVDIDGKRVARTTHLSISRETVEAGRIQKYSAADESLVVWATQDERTASANAFAPTHRHADGGLYRFRGNGKYKRISQEDWTDAVIYEAEDGKVYVTTPARWRDRFTPISAADSAASGSCGAAASDSMPPVTAGALSPDQADVPVGAAPFLQSAELGKTDAALLPGLKEALLWKPNTPQLENAMTYAWEQALKSFISAIEKAAPSVQPAAPVAECSECRRLNNRLVKIDAALDELGAPKSEKVESLTMELSHVGRIKRLASANTGTIKMNEEQHIPVDLAECLRILRARHNGSKGGTLSPAEMDDLEAAAGLLGLCWSALVELGHRIEKCGASVELTHAVTLCEDLRRAVGNKSNQRDKYAEERVRKEISPPDRESNK